MSLVFSRTTRGAWDVVKTIVGLLIAIPLVLIMFHIFSEDIKALFGGSSEDQDTINALGFFQQNLAQLTAETGKSISCNYAIFPFYLGSAYALIGFDQGDPNVVRVYDDCHKNGRRKPSICGQDACLCLYNTDTWDKNPSDDTAALLGLVNQHCARLSFTEITSIRGEPVAIAGTFGGEKKPIMELIYSTSYEDAVLFGGSDACGLKPGCPECSAAPEWGSHVMYLEITQNEEQSSLMIAKYHPTEGPISRRKESCEQLQNPGSLS